MDTEVGKYYLDGVKGYLGRCRTYIVSYTYIPDLRPLST